MNREEWREYWEWYESLPVADVLAVRMGCNLDELPDMPELEGVETVGDLAAIKFDEIWIAHITRYNDLDPEQKQAATLAMEALRREKQKTVFLPKITVYRAGLESIDETPDYLSWTTSLEVARFFQRRHRGGSIYRASIRPCDVIAYNDGRDEYEVLQYRGVFDVEEMEG